MNGGVFNFEPNSAGSTESDGVLTLSSGGATINLFGGGNYTLTFASLTQSVGATLNYVVNAGAVLGTSGGQVIYTSAPGLSPSGSGILVRETVTNGSNFDFATYTANGIAAFANYNATNSSNINVASATDTVEVNSGFSATTLTASKTLGALAFNRDNLTVGGFTGATLTLTSGGILVTNATTLGDVLSVPIVAFAGAEGIFHINTNSLLTVTSALTGTAGITKADGGNLDLNTPEYNTGTVTINAGTLTLGGGNNTLNYTSPLTVNGGTLELAGNSQMVGLLTSGANTVTGLGGVIQSTIGSGQAVLAVSTGRSRG